MADFNLAWTPGAGVSSQTLQYRVKNSGNWLTYPNLTPANPLSSTANSVDTSSLSNNNVYQFQVVSNCCPGTTVASDIVEGIIYEDMVATATVAVDVITVTQSVIPAIQIIEYTLKQGSTTIQIVSGTGAAPTAVFNPVASDTYTIKYRYATMIDGVLLYSDDVTQEGAFYTTGSIIVS